MTKMKARKVSESNWKDAIRRIRRKGGSISLSIAVSFLDIVYGGEPCTCLRYSPSQNKAHYLLVYVLRHL